MNQIIDEHPFYKSRKQYDQFKSITHENKKALVKQHFDTLTQCLEQSIERFKTKSEEFTNNKEYQAFILSTIAWPFNVLHNISKQIGDKQQTEFFKEQRIVYIK